MAERTPATNIRLKESEKEALLKIAENNGNTLAGQVRSWIRRDSQDTPNNKK